MALKINNSDRKTPSASQVAEILLKHHYSLATAESCTGGLIGQTITSLPGSSRYYLGGVIAYNNRIKETILGVSPDILKKHGAVSHQTVAAMAKGVMDLFTADCAISVSGVAGPDGGSAEKPVGLVYIGIGVLGKIITHECHFAGDRETVQVQAAQKALELATLQF